MKKQESRILNVPDVRRSDGVQKDTEQDSITTDQTMLRV